MYSKRAIPLAAAVLGGVFLYGCSRPEASPIPAPPLATERVTLIKSVEAPLLPQLKKNKETSEGERAGLALLVLKTLPPMAWKAKMGDVITEREGPMAEVRISPGDGILFGFRSDFGDEVEIPTTAAICARITLNPASSVAMDQARCAAMLLRYRLPSGTLLAYEFCATGPCPVAVVRNGVVSSLTVDGVIAARLIPGEGDGTLLLTSRWIRADGAWSGSRLVPVSLAGGPPVALPEIALDEVDARDPKTASSRAVRVDISSTAGSTVVHLVGDRRVKSRDDGRDLSTTAVDETHRLAVK